VSYIGVQPTAGQYRQLDDISSGFNGSTTSFTTAVGGENVTATTAQQLLVSLGGVIQEPNVDYTTSTYSITFTTAPSSGLDFFAVLMGDAVNVGTPADGTVTPAKLSTGGPSWTAGGDFSVAGDLTVDTDTLYVDSTNNRVGIGTTSPARVLDVVSTQQVVGHFESSSSTLARIGFSDANTTDDTRVGIGAVANDLTLYAGATERARIDSSGRLLVGTSTTIGGGETIQCHNTGGDNFAVGRFSSNAGGGDIALYKSRGAVGTNTLVSDADSLGLISFRGADGSSYIRAATIEALVDGTPGAGDMPGRLVFSTTADGASSPTEAMRISSDGLIYSVPTYTYTTASAANVNVNAPGLLRRSTSSIKYKTNVETIEDQYADKLLQCRPVWYRSTCKGDRPEHSWWGFIAEEVAEIDPRLVHWKTVEVTYDEKGSAIETPCDPEPEGVAYDRFVPHLLNLIKRQKEQIEAMEARLSALEAQ